MDKSPNLRYEILLGFVLARRRQEHPIRDFPTELPLRSNR